MRALPAGDAEGGERGGTKRRGSRSLPAHRNNAQGQQRSGAGRLPACAPALRNSAQPLPTALWCPLAGTRAWRRRLQVRLHHGGQVDNRDRGHQAAGLHGRRQGLAAVLLPLPTARRQVMVALAALVHTKSKALFQSEVGGGGGRACQRPHANALACPCSPHQGRRLPRRHARSWPSSTRCACSCVAGL